MSAPRTLLPTLLFASCLARDPSAQEPLVARYRDGSVSKTEFFLECARRLHNRPVGQDALENIVSCELVRQEAATRGVKAEAAEIDARLRKMADDMRGTGGSLEKHLAGKGISESEFREYVRLLIQHEKMAMADLGMTDLAKLTPQQMELWLRDMQRKRGVDRDKKLRSSGVVAVVGSKSLTLRDLGESIARAIDQDERRRVIRQVVGIELVERDAAKEGLSVSEADLDKALDERRKEVESDPRYQKSSYAKILEAQGTSPEEVRSGPVLRTQVLVEKLVARKYPPEAVAKLYEQDQARHDRRFGVSRRMRDLLVRGAERKNRLTSRTFEDARRECEQLAAGIRSEMTFEVTARTHSEDEALKLRGGDRGFVHRDQEGVEPALTEALFALPLGTLSRPIRAADGYHLVMAAAERPAPPREEILERVREEVSQQFLNHLVEEAGIEYLDQ